MTNTPEARHWLWTAIAAGQKVHAVRELHRSEMHGGLATGKCKECRKSYPCPTAQAVAREPDGPCTCGPDCPKNAGTLAASGEQPVSRPTTYDEPSWKLYNKLLHLGVTVDEATALMHGYAHEQADRARAGIALFEDHVGGFQYAREMREIIDVVDPTTPDPEGWDF